MLWYVINMYLLLFLFVCSWSNEICFVFQIRSDFEANETIRYSLEGIGANQKPFDLFVVNPENGFIRLTQKLDREKIDTYNVSDL